MLNNQRVNIRTVSLWFVDNNHFHCSHGLFWFLREAHDTQPAEESSKPSMRNACCKCWTTAMPRWPPSWCLGPEEIAAECSTWNVEHWHHWKMWFDLPFLNMVIIHIYMCVIYIYPYSYLVRAIIIIIHTAIIYLVSHSQRAGAPNTHGCWWIPQDYFTACSDVYGDDEGFRALLAALTASEDFHAFQQIMCLGSLHGALALGLFNLPKWPFWLWESMAFPRKWSWTGGFWWSLHIYFKV